MFKLTRNWLTIIMCALIFLSCNKDNSSNLSNGLQNENKVQHYIVVLKQQSGSYIQSPENAMNFVQGVINSFSIPQLSIGHIYDEVIYGFSADLDNDLLIKLNNDPRIEYIEKDQVITLVDQVEQIFEIDNKSNAIQSQTIPWGITNVGGPSTTTNLGYAWIVDTGINLTHSDLNVYSTRCTTFVRTGNDSKSAEDLNGHGSHVAGIIGAKNNNIGSVGVVPNARLVAVKVLNSAGSGAISDIVAGLNYVYKYSRTGDVVNLSLGGSPSASLDNAVSQFGNRNSRGDTIVYITIAAGNSADNAANYSPSRVNGKGIYTISAYDVNNKFAYFSNYGNPPIDYSAPGVSIYSTYKNGGYATLSGTSMAAPHVAGIILARKGAPATNGTVTGDLDNIPDVKAHL